MLFLQISYASASLIQAILLQRKPRQKAWIICNPFCWPNSVSSHN